MAVNTAAATSLLRLIQEATAWANVADDAASSPLTNLYISLHSSDPGAAGDQTTNEVGYTSYARVAVARSGSGWTVTGNQAVNDADISFPASTGGSATATHFAIGTASSGAGSIIFRGALTSSASIASGSTPKFAAGALTVTVTTSI